MNLVDFLSQSFEFSGKKPNKTPVKQNGPAGKPSGSAVRPQMKVGKALSPAQFYFLVVSYLKKCHKGCTKFILQTAVGLFERIIFKVVLYISVIAYQRQCNKESDFKAVELYSNDDFLFIPGRKGRMYNKTNCYFEHGYRPSISHESILSQHITLHKRFYSQQMPKVPPPCKIPILIAIQGPLLLFFNIIYKVI